MVLRYFLSLIDGGLMCPATPHPEVIARSCEMPVSLGGQTVILTQEVLFPLGAVPPREGGTREDALHACCNGLEVFCVLRSMR